MEAAAIFAIIGALVGAAFGAGWYAVDILREATTITDAKFGACIILGAIATPAVLFSLWLLDEIRSGMGR